MPNAQSVSHDVGTRLQALALVELGVPLEHIKAITLMSSKSVYRLKRQARERGYNPEVSRQLKLAYVVDKPRTGRPKKYGRVVEQDTTKTIREDGEEGDKESGSDR